MPTVWICGGGTFVEALRRWQAVHGLHDRVAHFAAIHLMGAALKLMRSWFPNWAWKESLGDLKEWLNQNRSLGASDNAWFDGEHWLNESDALPQSWSATSDSIAAALAVELSASELVLLKSTRPRGIRRDNLSNTGIVDKCFATIAQPIATVRIVDFRSPDFAEWRDEQQIK